jgi:hypothetical protein
VPSYRDRGLPWFAFLSPRSLLPSHAPAVVYSQRFSRKILFTVRSLISFRFLFVFFLLSALSLAAEPPDPHPVHPPHVTSDIWVLRGSLALQSPHRAGYRLFEWAQQRGRWIAPDVGYYDDGYWGYQLWFIGAGGEVVHRPHMVWTEELYANQAAGRGTRNERSFWFWTVFDFKLRPGLTAQAVGYPTLPLNKAQDWGLDIDRAKLEWEVRPHWLIGPGYAATTFDRDSSWENHPFVTVTRKARSGDYEIWFQRIPNGAQVQLRYQLVRDERSK